MRDRKAENKKRKHERAGQKEETYGGEGKKVFSRKERGRVRVLEKANRLVPKHVSLQSTCILGCPGGEVPSKLNTY